MRRNLRWWLLPLVFLLASCGGGDSKSGGGGSTTPFVGPWFLVATLNINVGGSPTFLTDTTRILVGASGNAVIISTDSECSLNIFINGDVLTYETTCIFTATSENATAPCVLTLRATARIRGPVGSAAASGSFGPETDACSGVATSFTGNLVASQGEGPDDGTDTDTDTDTGTDEDPGDPA